MNYMNENGYVNTENVLNILNRTRENLTNARKDIDDMLAQLGGIEENVMRQKEDNGAKLSAEEILKLCTLESGIMRLPKIQLNKKAYAKVKQYIEEAGGVWNGGKTQGFSFPFNPERVFAILKEGKRCNLQQDYQFFETPQEIATWLVSLVGGINTGDIVLEPSAGRGAIIRAIQNDCKDIAVDCYELMPENKEFLHSVENINLCGDDFIKECDRLYTKIVANPPFSNNQDIDHVLKMYDLLLPGGVLAAIMSNSWTFNTSKKATDFREWLKSVNGQVLDIPKGKFKESGTMIETTAIVIRRPVK